MRPSVNRNRIGTLQTASRRLTATRHHLGSRQLSSLQSNPPTAPTMASQKNTKAPWRDLLASHLKQTPGYTFNIATVGQDSKGRVVPRVRTCGCRGFFPELELHPSGQKDMDQQVENGGNPALYESDMLTFTTDVRMEKLPQLDASGHAIEATFWLEDLMTQWRVKGQAVVIGSCFGGEESEEEEQSRKAIGEYLRTKVCNADVAQWTWENAVTKYFANHSPAMRGMSSSVSGYHIWMNLHSELRRMLELTIEGSFRNPPPGQPRSQAPSHPSLSLGQRVTDLYDPVARANFRVVSIIADEVERLDLSNQDDIQREKWTYIETSEGGSTGRWEQMDLWP